MAALGISTSTKVVLEQKPERVEAFPWDRSNSRPQRPVAEPTRQTGGAPETPKVAAEEVERRIEAITRDYERKLRDAHQAGVQEGLKTAKGQAEGELKAALERVAASMAQVLEAKGRMLEQAQSEVVDLALEIARRVLHRELTTDPGAIEGVVRAALQKLTAQEITRVRVDAISQEAVQQALARHRHGPAIEVVTDPTLGRGSLIFEIHNGSLDASIETQLREIERGFADKVQNR